MTDPTPDAVPSSIAPGLEVPPDVAAPLPPPTRPSRTWSVLRVILYLVLLLLLLGLGFGSWQWWQQRQSLVQRVQGTESSLRAMSARLTGVETQAGELATRQSDVSRTTTRNAADVVALQSRIEESQKLMGRISDELSGGRTRFQLAAIESLLLMANDRLQLEHDVGAAITALETADQRIAALGDPRLFPVREAIAEERTALRAVPRPDIASATLSLGSLIDRVPQLPLISHAPSRFESSEARDAGVAPDTTGWQRMLGAVRATVRSLFTVRRDDNSRSNLLLPPEAESVVYNVLVLKLEGARVALQRSNTVAMRDQLRSASAWLDAQFKPDDPGVLAARGEIDRLQSLELSPPLPDIGRSLERLRLQIQPEGAADH